MPAQLIHFEIPARDVQKASAFYGALLGWSFDADPGFPDYCLARDTQPQAAVSGGEGGTPTIYLGAEDLDAALAEVTRLGGAHEPPEEIPGVGRYAHCRDDQDTSFSLYQPAA